MEDISTENSEVDEGAMEMSQYCLGLPTILRQILEHFSTTDLIELSLVNKLWNFEARSVMRERENLRATVNRRLDPPPDSCQQLVAFGSGLEKMRIVPFTGLHISLLHRGCESFSDGSLHPAYQVILDRLPLKDFSISFCNHWVDYKDCPALLLVQKIVENSCGVLEELCLEFGREEFLRSVFQNRSLPSLKILIVEKEFREPDDDEPEDITDAFLKTLVSSAPNLEELHVGGGDNSFKENILEGSSAILVPRRCDFRPLFHQVCESLIGSVRAETMEILLQEEDVDPQLLYWHTPRLLYASSVSLETLQMDWLFAVPLMCYGIRLVNVTKLQIHMVCYSLRNLEPSIRRLPTGLDFTRIFPSLTEVTILNSYEFDFSPDLIGIFVGQARAVLNRALPDRAINIEVLKIDRCTWLPDLILPLLAQMFPTVKKVQVQQTRERTSLADLREHFPSLEEVIDSGYPWS